MKKAWIFLFLAFGWGTSARADAPVLTWRDCVQMAAARNPDLLASLQAQQSTHSQYLGSYNGILPHLSVSNGYSDSSFSTNNNGQVINSEQKTWQLQGNASLDLFDAGQWASIQSAAAAMHQSEANQKVVSSTVLLNLYKAFAALMFAQEEVGVNQRISDVWNTNAQMINLRYDSGAESKGDNMHTKAQAFQAQLAVEQARRDIVVAQQQLSQAIGQDHYSALVVTGTWAVNVAVSTSPADIDAWVDRHPSVLAQQAAVDLAHAALRTARSPLLPTLSLNFNKGVQGSSELPTNPFWTFSGLLNYPLFGAGLTATYFNTRAADATYEAAQLTLRSTRNQIRSALVQAWSSVAQSQDQVQIQQALLNAALQRKGEADVMYQSGLMSFQDWQLVINDYVNAERNFLGAEQNLLLAEGQWRNARGESLGE